MTTSTVQSPAAPFTTALRSIFGRLAFPAPKQGQPKLPKIRHLDDHMLRDIGLERYDTMGSAARAASTSLAHRNLW